MDIRGVHAGMLASRLVPSRFLATHQSADEEAPSTERLLASVSGEDDLSPLGFVWRVATDAYAPWMLAMLVGEAVHAGAGIMLPYALGRILARVTGGGLAGAAAFDALTPSLLLFAGLCFVELGFGRLNSALQLRVAPRQRQHVARALFQHLHGHSHRFLSERFAGALAHRIGETSHGVNQVLWSLLTELWPIAIVIVVSIVLLATASGWLALFAGGWALAFVAVSYALSRHTQPLSAAASSARSKTAGAIVDSVVNHAAVRLFAALDHERARLDATYRDEFGIVMRANLAMERVRLVQFGASAVLKTGIVALSVWLWSRGAIGPGEFAMAVTLALLIIAEVRNLSRRFLELFEYLGNVGSGVRAILVPHEIVDPPLPARTEPQGGEIALDAVSFAYPNGKRVFERLSVRIPHGQRVGLVGSSGSGKSSFVSLLLRLYDPQEGSVRVGGVDVRALDQTVLRRSIGMIPQDPQLFHRSLRENVRYGRPAAADAEVEAAVARALAAEFIAEPPEGYEAEVGERGVKLSGGQRQRIAIARVVLKDAPILVLDEATASLDSLTELAIQRELDAVMGDKTAIVIAHRLSTVAHLDRILVFERGVIVEDGTHAELLARGGIYTRLWGRQSLSSDQHEGVAAAQ
jgi:ATP-binding cassette, subfamily B, bacterial